MIFNKKKNKKNKDFQDKNLINQKIISHLLFNFKYMNKSNFQFKNEEKKPS